MENKLETASENRFKTSKYFLDQVRFLEINERLLKYIHVFSFSELDLPIRSNIIKSLRRMSISEIDAFRSGRLVKFEHLPCIDPFFVDIYAELIDDYSIITECTRQEACDYFQNLEWNEMLAILNEKSSQCHCLFYHDASIVNINDQAEAGEAGIILIDSFSLESLHQIEDLHGM